MRVSEYTHSKFVKLSEFEEFMRHVDALSTLVDLNLEQWNMLFAIYDNLNIGLNTIKVSFIVLFLNRIIDGWNSTNKDGAV